MAQWYWPVAGGRPGQVTTPYGAPQTITSGYGANFGGKPKNAAGQPINTGVDVPGRAGQAVLNLDDGVVEEVRVYSPAEEAAGRDSTGGYGNSVVIRLNTGQRVRYSHMQQPPQFAKGQRVGGGQQLGTIGDTGNATGPHLDLEMQDERGQYIDPMVTGGWTAASQPTQGLGPPPGQWGASGAANGRGVTFANELPPGAQVGVPFRQGTPPNVQRVGQALGNVIGYADELPPGATIGQRVQQARESMANTTSDDLILASLPPGVRAAVEAAMRARRAIGSPPAAEAAPSGQGSGFSGPGGGPGGPGGKPPGPDEPGSTTTTMGVGASTAQASPGQPDVPEDVDRRQGGIAARGADDAKKTPEAIIREEAAKAGLNQAQADLAVAIAAHESGLDPTRANTNGEDSHGLFQLNRGIPGKSTGAGTGYTIPQLEDPRRNAEIGVALLKNALANARPDQSPGDVAKAAQRPGDPNYVQRINDMYKRIQEAGPGNAAAALGGAGATPGNAPGQSSADPAVAFQERRLSNAKFRQEAANAAAVKARAAIGAEVDPKDPDITAKTAARNDRIKAADEADKAAQAAGREVEAAEGDLIKARDAAGKTEASDWKLDTVNGKPVWVNSRTRETQPYTGPGSDPTKKVIGGTGSESKYVVVDNGDGTVSYQENKNYTGGKPTQVSGLGADTEYVGFVDENGKTTYQKNPGYNPNKAYESGGRVTLIDSKTGRVVSTTDTLPPEEREAARTKTLAEADKLKADAESARIKADLDKKDAEEWAKIEEAVKSGNYTPQQINTMVLTAAKNVTDYANLLKAENERNTLLETQRHNLAGEETETRKTRVSEQDSARQATESYGRYGVASAPWQTMLLGAQAPIADPRKAGARMNIDEDVIGPVAERYEGQRQQQEEFQNARREKDRQALQPFFGPYKPPGATGAIHEGGNGPAGANANPPGVQPAGGAKPIEGADAVDLKDAGRPGWARTYYDDGTSVDWRIPDAAPQPSAAPTSASAAPPAEQESSPPPSASPQAAPQSSTSPTANRFYSGNAVPGGSPAETERAQGAATALPPAQGPISPEPQSSVGPTFENMSSPGGDYGSRVGSDDVGYAGIAGAQDASFKYGRDDQPGMNTMEPIPNVQEPPGGFWDGVSPLTPEQQAFIDSQRQNLVDSPEGGGGAVPAQPQSLPGPDQHGVGGYFTGGGGYTREDGSTGWMPPMYVPRFSPGGAGEGGGGGGGGGAAGPPKRRRLPVPGKHIIALQSPGWARTHYDDGSHEDWHVEDGPSFEGLGGRGAGFHGEPPPTYGIGWEEGTAGGGGSVWSPPQQGQGGGGDMWAAAPTPGVVPGMMGQGVAMNPGGPYGGGIPKPPSPPEGGGISGGFGGPAAGGGGDPNAAALTGGMAGDMGAMGAPPAAPSGPIEPLSYNGGGQYVGGGAGGGMPSMFAPGQSAYSAPGSGVASGPGSQQGAGMAGSQSAMRGTAPMWDAAMGQGFTPGAPSGISTLFTPKGLGGGAALATTARSGGYYGGPAQPTPNTPLSRLLQQTGVLPQAPGSAAGAPGTV